MRVHAQLEEWEGESQPIHVVGTGYRRLSAREFKDYRARLTARQAVFYRNLIRIALETGQNIPIDFEYHGDKVHLDRGCIKIAVHAGFIEELEDRPDGVVDSIRLRWRTDGVSIIL